MFILLSPVRAPCASARPPSRLSVRLPIPPRLRRLHVQVVIASFHHCGTVTAATARSRPRPARHERERARGLEAWFVEVLRYPGSKLSDVLIDTSEKLSIKLNVTEYVLLLRQ